MKMATTGQEGIKILDKRDSRKRKRRMAKYGQGEELHIGQEDSKMFYRGTTECWTLVRQIFER
jgi:hypothetical protein